jgi:uncharacterized membrane protein
MRCRNLIVFATASLLLSGCGPSQEESARAVMMATPVVYLAGMGIMALMLFLWRKLEPRLGINWNPVLLGLALACVIGLLSIVGVTNDPPNTQGRTATDGIPGVVEWVGFAIVFYGTSYLSVLLVIWRIWLWRRPATAFTWAWTPVLFVMMAPCPAMIMSTGEHSVAMHYFSEAGRFFWTFPGFIGMVTGPLLLLALIEVWVRIRQRRRKRPPRDLTP